MPDVTPVILIIKDEEAVQASYEIILRDNYDLILAETGEEGLKTLNQRSDIGLIFLDYILPGMDGLEFMKKFREGDWNIPVIVVTGKGSEEVAASFSADRIYLPRFHTIPIF
jgi:DNA-binding NtrC family response regulator